MKAFLILSVLVALMLTVEANYKKTYCHNQDYVGNTGSRYPHLHCGKTFLTLSRSSSKHDNLQGRCSKVREILGDSKFYYGDNKEIGAVLNVYYKDGCPKLRREAVFRQLLKPN